MPEPPPKTQLARKLRKDASLPERILWSYINDRKLGVKFRRQQPIGDYCVDFFSPELKLILEVDGSHHDFKLDYDLRRKQYLESKGYKVLTIQAKSILKDLDTALEYLTIVIEERRTELGPELPQPHRIPLRLPTPQNWGVGKRSDPVGL